MLVRQLALAVSGGLLAAALVLSADQPALAVGITTGATNTSVPPPTATNTQVLYIPQTPRPTSTTATILISFTASPTPPPGSTVAPTPTKTFTPPAAASVASVTQTTAPTSTMAPDTATPQATPSSAATAPTSTAAPPGNGVVINEVLSNPQTNWDWGGAGPASQTQWVELYNATSATIDMTGWRLTTSAISNAQARVFGIQSIAPGGYLVFFKRDLGFDLANVVISLLDSNEQTVDSVSVPSLPPDYTFARLPDGSSNWVAIPSPTLGGANAFLTPTSTPDLQATLYAVQTALAQPQPSPPVFDDDLPDATEAESGARSTRLRKGQPFRSLSISGIRGLPDDSAVITTGMVTLPTGAWDPSRAYIQDGAGILIHSFGEQPLGLGDSLTIRGRVHHFHGEVEIAAVRGGEQVASGGVSPDPQGAAPSAIGRRTEALLIQVKGELKSLEREYATLADGSGSGRVFLYSRLGYRTGSLTAGQTLVITGVVNAEANGQVGSHRLLPRSLADLAFGGSGSDAEPVDGQSRPSAGGSNPTGRDASSRALAPGPAFVGATPTEFVTPVLPGRQPSSVNNQPEAAKLMLFGSSTDSAPWLWPVIAVGGGLLAGGGIGAGLRWRHARANRTKEPD